MLGAGCRDCRDGDHEGSGSGRGAAGGGGADDGCAVKVGCLSRYCGDKDFRSGGVFMRGGALLLLLK